tara:strand:+ start:4171 stop:4797 length:627 start_codon:yes stop_codon:yes gene_type:complete
MYSSSDNNGNLELITYPSTQVVTTAELKAQLRIDTSDEDTLLVNYIIAATQMAENYCNRHFIRATYKLWWNTSMPSEFNLIYPDVYLDFGTSVPGDDGLWYLGPVPDAVYTNWGFTNYYLSPNENPPRVIIKTPIPNDRPISDLDGDEDSIFYFQFQTGYGALASDVPGAIKQAIKLIASDMYYFREDRKRTFPMASQILLQPYKCYH